MNKRLILIWLLRYIIIAAAVLGAVFFCRILNPYFAWVGAITFGVIGGRIVGLLDAKE